MNEIRTKGPAWNFEGEPPCEEMSETGSNLCVYFDAINDTHLKRYAPKTTDEQLMEWGDNFTRDRKLLLTCCESDEVDVDMYRRYNEECIRYRNPARDALLSAVAA
jgi:hypothetical protein